MFAWTSLLVASISFFPLTVNPQGAPSNPPHHIQYFTTYSPTKCQSAAPSSFLRLTGLDLCTCQAVLENATNRGRASFVRESITYNEPQAGADEAADQLHWEKGMRNTEKEEFLQEFLRVMGKCLGKPFSIGSKKFTVHLKKNCIFKSILM